MRKIDESQITSTSEMFFKKGTWTHLQASYTEIFDALMRREFKNASNSTVYVIYGCKNTGAGSNYIISAGAVFYNGEIYLVDAATFTAGVGKTAVATITTTQYTTYADPVTFSDGNPKNVHNIRKMVIAAGTSGSGTKDYSAFEFYGSVSNYTDISASVTLHASFSGANKTVRKYDDGTVELSINTAVFGSNISAGQELATGLPLPNCLIGVYRARLSKSSPAATTYVDVYITSAGKVINASLFDNATYDTADFYLTYKMA